MHSVEAGPDGGHIPLKFRYEVKPDAQTNAFKPKPVEKVSGIRSAQFGAIFHDRILQIPAGPHCGIVWEVGFFQSNRKGFNHIAQGQTSHFMRKPLGGQSGRGSASGGDAPEAQVFFVCKLLHRSGRSPQVEVMAWV